MALGEYLRAVSGLAAVIVPLALAAVRLRGRFLPGWEGAPARLVEAVLGASLLTVILQLLGAVGLFDPHAIVLASIGVGAAIWFGVSPPEAEAEAEAEAPPSPQVNPLHLVLALGAVAFLLTHWATGLQDVWGRGIVTFDSLWYHGPFSARIAEAGTAWPLHFSDPLYLNWFYPENSEIQHAFGISLFHHDLLSPFLNFAWLGLALLAAWCIGRPYGVGALSLVAVAIVLDTGPMVPREAGTMANDIAPIALLLAAAAVLVNGTPRGSKPSSQVLLLAGLAAGLALGTKMTIAGGVAALAIGVVFLVPRETRLKAFGVFLGGVAITAGFWFVRNLFHTGNPLPWINEVGPVDLPGPDRGLEGRDPYSVSHYIFENRSGDVWSTYIFDGVRNLLGPGWFLILGGAGAGALLALLRPRSPAIRVLGVVSIAAGIAYLFTPLTAAGPDGDPRAFTINFRYALAAISLALALLPLWAPIGEERVRFPGLGRELSGDLLRSLLLAGGLVVLVVTSQYSDSASIWDGVRTSIPWAVLIALVLVGGTVGLGLVARRSGAVAASVGAALAIAVVAIGYARQDDYIDDRYAAEGVFDFQLEDAAQWIDENTGEARVAVAGTTGAYNQYGFYGEELDNHVQYVGEERSGGDFRRIDKCVPWIVALNDGGYEFLVTSPDLDLNAPEEPTPAPERGWVATDPNAERILSSGRVALFRLNGPLDPARCKLAAAQRQ